MNITNSFSIVKIYDKVEHKCIRCHEQKARYYIFYIDGGKSMQYVPNLCRNCVTYYRLNSFSNHDSIPFKFLFKLRKEIRIPNLAFNDILTYAYTHRKENLNV